MACRNVLREIFNFCESSISLGKYFPDLYSSESIRVRRTSSALKMQRFIAFMVQLHTLYIYLFNHKDNYFVI